MSAQQILDDNFELKNNSFLYFLRDKSTFKRDALKDLCVSIRDLAEEEVMISLNAQKINFIYAEVLKCVLYHFDPNDKFRIENLPENYNKQLAQLEKFVYFYFKTRI